MRDHVLFCMVLFGLFPWWQALVFIVLRRGVAVRRRRGEREEVWFKGLDGQGPYEVIAVRIINDFHFLILIMVSHVFGPICHVNVVDIDNRGIDTASAGSLVRGINMTATLSSFLLSLTMLRSVGVFLPSHKLRIPGSSL